MLRSSPFLACAAALLLALCAGCAATLHGRSSAARGAASGDYARAPNPNAPYILAGQAPKLIPRPTALDAEHAGPCDPDVLSVEEIAGNASGIFRSVKLAFMNRGAAPCRIGGYPGVVLQDQAGLSLGSITMEQISNAQLVAEFGSTQAALPAPPLPTVTLMPHAAAAFQVVWTAGSGCSSVARIVVTAPGTQRGFSLNRPMRVCAGRIQVTQLRLDEGDS